MVLDVKSVDRLLGTPVPYAYVIKAGPWIFLTGHEAYDWETGISVSASLACWSGFSTMIDRFALMIDKLSATPITVELLCRPIARLAWPMGVNSARATLAGRARGPARPGHRPR